MEIPSHLSGDLFQGCTSAGKAFPNTQPESPTILLTSDLKPPAEQRRLLGVLAMCLLL